MHNDFTTCCARQVLMSELTRIQKNQKTSLTVFAGIQTPGSCFHWITSAALQTLKIVMIKTTKICESLNALHGMLYEHAFNARTADTYSVIICIASINVHMFTLANYAILCKR